MTAAERQAVSARMKGYWATRRDGKAPTPTRQEPASEATAKPGAVKRGARKGGRKKR